MWQSCCLVELQSCGNVNMPVGREKLTNREATDELKGTVTLDENQPDFLVPIMGMRRGLVLASDAS